MNEYLNKLPIFEIGCPGQHRDALISKILLGDKVATTYPLGGEDVEHVLAKKGQGQLLIGSHMEPIAVLQITDVSIVELGNVDESVVRDEGEGFLSIEEWRDVHERYWLGDSYGQIQDKWNMPENTPIVVERFRISERIE